MRINKRYVHLLLCMFLIVTSIPLYPSSASGATITVTVKQSFNPGYYWCQHIDGTWSTSSTIQGAVVAPNDGGEPRKTWVKTSTNISAPLNVSWEDANGNTYSGSEVKNPKPKSVTMQVDADPALQGNPTISGNTVYIEGYSGKGVHGYTGAICGGNNNMIYPFPVTVTFEGTIEVTTGTHTTRHYTTAGQSLQAVFPDVVRTMTKDQSYSTTPPANSEYTYVGYKFSKDGSPPTGGNIIEGSPPVETYDGTYTHYYLYLYYKAPEAFVRHVNESGQSLSSIFTDTRRSLVNGQNYSFPAPTNANYQYLGFVRSTTGSPPTDFSSPTNRLYELTPYTGNFNTLYLYHVYRPVGDGEIKVRHMVRQGPNGSFTLANETSEAVSTLPASRTVNPVASHGTLLGRNVNYSGYTNAIDQGNSITVNLTTTNKTGYVSFFYEQPVSFTVNFDVLPSTIEYRDSFSLVPKDFHLNGCTYIAHKYQISRNGIFETPWISGQTVTTSYSHSNYPWNIGTGQHMITIKINTSCGQSEWLSPKTLTVTSPTNNRPPEFRVGFVHPNEQTRPVHEVVEGTTMNLIYITDPSVPTPTDPDGDLLTFMGFDTVGSDSAFIQSLPSKGTLYANGYHQITMDTTGYHHVTAQMRDQWGLTATASTWILVVPRNPVAVPGCPAEVKSGRPIPLSEFTSTNSYSPVGRTIDHSRDEWTNLQTNYTNDTSSDITVQVSLHVYDRTGMRSLDPGVCNIIVKPDLPPIAKLEVPPVGIRHQMIDILNKSTSPDGDAIVKTQYKYKYDQNNDGFEDDEWIGMVGTLNRLPFTPTEVGKYLFYVKVTEEYGQTDDTLDEDIAILTLDVINNAPEVSFDIEGNNPQPDLNPSSTISAAQMLNWPVYVTNEGRQVYNKNNLWQVQNGRLVSGEGKNFGQQQMFQYFVKYPTYSRWNAFDMSNNGFGPNRLSPYRAATNTPQFAFTLANPSGRQLVYYDSNYRLLNNLNYSQAAAPKMRSTKNLFIFDEATNSGMWNRSMRIYGLDPKKLSPIESYFQNGSLLFRYKNGSPFVFDIAVSQALSINWELAGHYLYVLRYTGEYELIVYNTLNGQQVRRQVFPLDFGKGQNNSYSLWEISHAQGTDIYLRSDISNSNEFKQAGKESTRWIKFTPDLNKTDLPSWTIPVARDSRVSSDDVQYISSRPLFTDPSGAIYAYEGFRQSSGTEQTPRRYYDLSVAKYNPDLTLAWRQYLTGPNELGYPTKASTGTLYNMYDLDQFNGLVINPFTNEVQVRTYQLFNKPGEIYQSDREIVSVYNTANGALKSRFMANDNNQGFDAHRFSKDNGSTIYFDFNGTKHQNQNSTVTTEGFRTTQPTACGPTNPVYNAAGIKVGDVVGNSSCTSNVQFFGEYFGDGFYVSLTRPNNSDEINYSLKASYGSPSTAPLVNRAFTNGQFLSNTDLANAEVSFTFSVADVDYDKDSLGFSFRMRDPRNRYAFETNGSQLSLTKYINGARTQLATGSYPLQDGQSYTLKLKFIGNSIEVWLNNIPVLQAQDNTYTTGKFGYFADKSFVTFSALRYKGLQNQEFWSKQFAIWNEGTAKADVRYSNILFTDPEKDPMAGTYQWNILHAPRFINNQGISSLHGKTFNSQQLTFDKVGDYTVQLRAKDDPHPNFHFPSIVFDMYRKTSNEFNQMVTVHRRPISDFTVAQDASGRVLWTDSSRDPDRYASATNYSPSENGIDYRATRGILEKRFYYITPSGNYVAQKIVTPQELGVYEVGMAVKDEYDAWSDYTVRMLNVGTLPPNNTPPVPGFTTSHVNTFRGIPVTIDSTA
ncbi:hypothetical protein, partial [Paenibacillus abyssi]|uniref:hypothetical protein n=1 Tax=Paenibacillus abyssi TaxID=1340531 RepID=UPI00166DA0E0